ncbi:MAG TPA: VOC family protein [candidate division Zixibacteria bacterium]|nr:VOC family protein [candidate division Zixibacteria bacterium]
MRNFNSFITFIRTDNLDKTTEFYQNIMKCPLVLDQGLCRIFKITKESYIGFCTHDFLDKEKESICLTFVCSSKEEVNEMYEYLKEKNVPMKEPPKENEKFKIYNFFAKDPNGITLEIQYFLHPFPPE